MTERPAPPVPAGTNLQGNEWFPLHFKRLRKSKWWRRASDLARSRNVMLWGVAYEEIPAGSLPDDDDELAEAAGFGMDADAFIAAKSEIMAPWTLCSDGRWYHPTMVEVVLEAWEKLSDRRKKENDRKAGQRAKARGVPLESGPVPPETEAVPRDTGCFARDIAPHAGASLTRQDRTREEHPQPPQGDLRDIAFDEALSAYPLAGQSSTRRPKALDAWLEAIRSETPERLVLAAKAYAASDYATEGKGRRVPSFQRWLSDRLFAPYLPPKVPASLWLGPPEVRAAVVAAKDEALAVGYLDRCRWRDLPEKAVVTANAYVAETLRRHAGDALAELGVSIAVEKGEAA